MASVGTIKIRYFFVLLSLFALLLGCRDETPFKQTNLRSDHKTIVSKSRQLIPMPPWPAGDQRGMANTLGIGTWMRCAFHLNLPDARVYELSHLRSNTMPSSPWVPPIQYDYSPTLGLPNSSIAWHTD